VGSIPASRTRISILEKQLRGFASRLFFFLEAVLNSLPS